MSEVGQMGREQDGIRAQVRVVLNSRSLLCVWVFLWCCVVFWWCN